MTTLPFLHNGSAALAIAGAALLGLATPAVANQGSSTATSQPAASAVLAGAAATATPTAKAKKYCFVDNVTGSRIPRKSCKTADEWKAAGVDVAQQ